MPFFLLLFFCLTSYASLCLYTSPLLHHTLFPSFSSLVSCFHHPEFFICTSSSLPLLSSHIPTSYPSLIFSHLFLLPHLAVCLLPSFLHILPVSSHPSPCSAPTQRAPGASPSAHNISSAAVSDRPNFSRGVGIRSTFHAGQQRGARDQQGSAYPGGPASPSLSHGNSQARRTHGATGIFSKFTSKFVRRWVKREAGAWENRNDN